MYMSNQCCNNFLSLLFSRYLNASEKNITYVQDITIKINIIYTRILTNKSRVCLFLLLATGAFERPTVFRDFKTFSFFTRTIRTVVFESLFSRHTSYSLRSCTFQQSNYITIIHVTWVKKKTENSKPDCYVRSRSVPDRAEYRFSCCVYIFFSFSDVKPGETPVRLERENSNKLR